VIHAVYEWIVIEGPRFVGLRLTRAAYRSRNSSRAARGLLWRPTGFDRADDIYIRIPIDGADAWLMTSDSA